MRSKSRDIASPVRGSDVDVQFPATQIEPPPSSHRDQFELLVMESRGLSTYPLPSSGTLSIGRAEGSDIRLEDPLASRSHALLHLGPLSVEDRGSANGTRVKGARIEPGQQVVLQAGEAISIGHAVLVVQARRSTTKSRRASAPRKEGSSGGARPPAIVVRDPAMVEVFNILDRVAGAPINLLILGETGVGKDVVAESAHRSSPRAKAPFVRINCAALPENLLESELFGHEPGSFTGAGKAKPGLLETAEKGTVFLDEVGELPLALQAKLLRVIEAREVMRVGGLRARPVDVRFISATNRDLEVEVQRGSFRSDLFFRLNGVAISVPPLRERLVEIEPLARMFVQRMADQLGLPQAPEISEDALEKLRAHSWPGNVRELRNIMERAVLLCSSGCIDAEHLPLDRMKQTSARPAGSDATGPVRTVERGRVASSPPLRDEDSLGSPSPPAAAAAAEGSPGADDRSQKRDVERSRIIDALQRCHGNQSRAAELLNMPRRTLVAKLAAYGIPRPRKTPPTG